MKLKSVLKRIEIASKKIAQLNPQNVKIISIKISSDNPDTGHFRLRAFLNNNKFIEVFEFYFSGQLIKYSYSLIKNKISILRYDNAPHHKNLNSFPHHKHIENEIRELTNPYLNEFLIEINDLK